MRWIIMRKFLKDCPELIFFFFPSHRLDASIYKDRSTNCIATNTFNTFVRSFFFFLSFFSPGRKSSTLEQYLAIVSARLEVTRRLLSLSGDKYAADAVDERRSFINHPLTRPHRFTQLYRAPPKTCSLLLPYFTESSWFSSTGLPTHSRFSIKTRRPRTRLRAHTHTHARGQRNIPSWYVRSSLLKFLVKF